MPDFDWKGIQNKQYVSGTVNALTRDEAAHKLKIDGIIITQLNKKLREAEKEIRESINWKALFAIKKKVKLAQVMIATKKMATMLRSGLSILPSLEMVRDQTENPTLKETMSHIYVDVESGSSLSQSFSKHPDIFNAIYINMVRAGESSGRLDTFLDKLVTSIRKTIKIRKSIQSAMLYPTILLIVATVVVGIMMIFVVPVFAQMFGSIGSQLPAPTLFIMSISNFLRDPYGGGLLLFTIVLSIYLFRQAVKRNLVFRTKWHRYLLKMPLIGEMILNSNLAQIAMVYGNLSGAGVPVIEALDITAESSKNEVIKEAIQTAKRGVFSGEPLSQLLGEIEIFPPTFSQLISVGEQTGNMTEMLETISSYFEEEFDSTVDKLSQMMEPIMICFLGGVIGFILVAMYLPIFKMGQVVTGS
ncbi:type II secretion system F family protein [Polynucleobacter sp. AP-Kolm-20A-A1]|uniref:type II secretion system F family protein n=1 Tax=Polynucleobacter sp. AP-Kolm-20A-A1 TaxID=2081041 RepID=UPI001BFCEB01|nr:type II secretion system F family protein [Polynucleobacter sp. AP-Kolm-20A-A1]QWE21464.1 type II secretion system F family protein [Polynucleobacter sp. AP-Kolm-20A-A1]